MVAELSQSNFQEKMEENNATQTQDQGPADVKPEIKPDVQHLTITVANQVG